MVVLSDKSECLSVCLFVMLFFPKPILKLSDQWQSFIFLMWFLFREESLKLGLYPQKSKSGLPRSLNHFKVNIIHIMGYYPFVANPPCPLFISNLSCFDFFSMFFLFNFFPLQIWGKNTGFLLFRFNSDNFFLFRFFFKSDFRHPNPRPTTIRSYLTYYVLRT